MIDEISESTIRKIVDIKDSGKSALIWTDDDMHQYDFSCLWSKIHSITSEEVSRHILRHGYVGLWISWGLLGPQSLAVNLGDI